MSCSIRKSLLFVVGSHPSHSDGAVQAARIALSVALEHHVVLVFVGDATVLCEQKLMDLKPTHEFFETERFLNEMEVPRFCIGGQDASSLREGILKVERLEDIGRQGFASIFYF